MDLSSDSGRPYTLVIVSNAIHPYRDHLHRRIVTELQLELVNFVTHGRGDFAWSGEEIDHVRRISVATRADEPTRSARRRPVAEFRKAGQILRRIGELSADAVIVEGYADAGRLRLLWALPRSGLPVFLRADSNVRGDDPGRLVGPLKRFIVGRVVAAVDAVLTVGRLGTEYFASYGAARDRCYTVPYEPDYEFWSRESTRDEAESVRTGLGVPTEATLFAFVGRLVPEKGVDLLIRALPRGDQAPWHLMIVGEGPDRQRLEALIPPSAREQVHFTGFHEPHAVRAVYRAADTLVVPSRVEPWGNVVTEAMAAGLPIIASDTVGAAFELIDSEEVGVVFPAEDTAALSEAIGSRLGRRLTPEDRLVVQDRLNLWREASDPIAGLARALHDHAGYP